MKKEIEKCEKSKMRFNFFSRNGQHTHILFRRKSFSSICFSYFFFFFYLISDQVANCTPCWYIVKSYLSHSFIYFLSLFFSLLSPIMEHISAVYSGLSRDSEILFVQMKYFSIFASIHQSRKINHLSHEFWWKSSSIRMIINNGWSTV